MFYLKCSNIDYFTNAVCLFECMGAPLTANRAEVSYMVYGFNE